MKSSNLELGDLSQRLLTIAQYVPDKKKVADIGADHALLFIHLAKQGRLQKGIVGELNRGPFENAQDRIRRMGLSSFIEVRKGDGLAVLQQGEVEVVVIAGMGGALISQILDEGKEKLSRVERLILQPNIGGKRVRQWLFEHQFTVVEETIVEEAGLFYEIIVAEPGENNSIYEQPLLTQEQLMEIGPILWQKKHSLLRKKLVEDLKGKKNVLKQLEKGRTMEAKRRKQEIEEEMKLWEKVIAWLSAAEI
ncbi:tRNA (adenine(22)-N(1))-methyltransferase [Hazenella coriacea]|nr:tRNA (adenine(22)-N(1))-methyltransferase TrmK [Hazenella coriacea]